MLHRRAPCGRGAVGMGQQGLVTRARALGRSILRLGRLSLGPERLSQRLKRLILRAERSSLRLGRLGLRAERSSLHLGRLGRCLERLVVRAAWFARTLLTAFGSRIARLRERFTASWVRCCASGSRVGALPC
jgi:hypothetical protein